ncbi:hypothetical protein ACG91D_12660 [Acinetobacter guillouiae]|uniref:hypothetical protein n=1 Tax=Acinetobacter guillouiae TaxID=106649 RepID=UPI003AF5AB1C
MKKILMLLISPVIAGSVYSAEDWSKKPQSYVFLQNEEPQYGNNNSEHVDFFELSKQQEQDRIAQREVSVAKMYESRANTSNMSPFERSQYLLKNNDTYALNAHENEQQLKSLQKARNRGVISERDYQQKMIKQNQMPLEQKNNQLKYSIPVGE